MELTKSLEDYLEAIYVLQKRHQCVRITDLAAMLNLSKPSVNRAINALKSEGLVIHEHYGPITLTEKGAGISEDIYSRHKILTKFLVENLNIAPEIAEKEACGMEHSISKETLVRLIDYLEKQEDTSPQVE